MRTTYAVIIVAAAAMIVAQGTRTLLVSPKADTTFYSSSSMSLDELHRNARDLPVQDIKDPF
jgi:hypothetical protein